MLSAGRVNLVIGVLCLLWGSTWVVIKGGLEHLPPLSAAAMRFALAALIMLVVGPALARREGGERPPLRLSASLGLFNFAGSYAIVYIAETALPSGLVSVLWGVFPMLSAGAGHFFLEGERLSPPQALGFLVGFVGLGVLFAVDLRLSGEGALAMAAFLLLSPTISVIGNTLAKRSSSTTSSALLNRDGMIVGASILVVLALVFEHDKPLTLNAQAIGSVLYLACFGTVTTFGLYFWALRSAPANKMSLIAYITPGIALWLGWLVYDEPVSSTLVLGTAMIIAGVWLAGKTRRS
jgi:drug/metabolite transporter (DMT)-like permease